MGGSQVQTCWQKQTIMMGIDFKNLLVKVLLMTGGCQWPSDRAKIQARFLLRHQLYQHLSFQPFFQPAESPLLCRGPCCIRRQSCRGSPYRKTSHNIQGSLPLLGYSPSYYSPHHVYLRNCNYKQLSHLHLKQEQTTGKFNDIRLAWYFGLHYYYFFYIFSDSLN